MNKPLTPGEIFDIAGLNLTKPQRERALQYLPKLGFTCEERPDGSILAWPKDQQPDEKIPPNYAAASKTH